MKKKNQQVKKIFGMIEKRKAIIVISCVFIFLFSSSFITFQNKNHEITGDFIKKMSNILGKRGGCENTKNALILMQAHQIIHKEFKGLTDEKDRINKINQLLKNSSCNNEYVFMPRDFREAVITTINGAITIKRELPPYILALEMMSLKQKEEFKKALPQSLQEEYLTWNLTNIEFKNEISKSLKNKGIATIDIDNNLSSLFQKALDETPLIKLEDYQIDKKELNKLLNNQILIQELNKQVGNKK